MFQGSNPGGWMVLAVAAAVANAPGLCHGQVANDDRANAIRVRPGQTVTALTALATPSPDPLPSTAGCAFLGWSSPRRDVWYRFDPPQPHGLLTLDLCGSNFDTSVVLYRLDEATGAIQQVACDDDECNPAGPGYQSRISDLPLSGDPRPILVRVAGWSDQVGTLRMRAQWVNATPTPVRFTSGGLFHDGLVQVGTQQATSAGPGTGGTVHCFVQGQAEVGVARFRGFLGAEIRSGWTGAPERVRIEGFLEAAKPAGSDGTSRIHCSDGTGDGGNNPLEFTLDSDRYFRISSSGSAVPTLAAGSGCVCGDRLTAGTYLLDIDFGVLVEGAETVAHGSIDWNLELRTTPFRSADLDGDGSVGGNDLGMLLSAWGAPGSADLDGDGTVGADDLGMLLAQWGS